MTNNKNSQVTKVKISQTGSGVDSPQECNVTMELENNQFHIAIADTSVVDSSRCQVTKNQTTVYVNSADALTLGSGDVNFNKVDEQSWQQQYVDIVASLGMSAIAENRTKHGVVELQNLPILTTALREVIRHCANGLKDLLNELIDDKNEISWELLVSAGMKVRSIVEALNTADDLCLQTSDDYKAAVKEMSKFANDGLLLGASGDFQKGLVDAHQELGGAVNAVLNILNQRVSSGNAIPGCVDNEGESYDKFELLLQGGTSGTVNGLVESNFNDLGKSEFASSYSDQSHCAVSEGENAADLSLRVVKGASTPGGVGSTEPTKGALHVVARETDALKALHVNEVPSVSAFFSNAKAQLLAAKKSTDATVDILVKNLGVDVGQLGEQA